MAKETKASDRGCGGSPAPQLSDEQVREVVRDLLSRVEKLEAQVAAIRAAGQPSLRRVAAREAWEGEPPLFDSKEVVPPTPTDDPDYIVGGAPTGMFPDCCAVGNSSGFFCSGTLIAKDVVVTAKHCQQVDRVFLKGRDVSFSSRGEVIPVKKQVCHPTEDLRLLILEHASSVSPRRIVRGDELGTPQEVTLAGFGTIDFSGTQGFGLKRKVTVPIIILDPSEEDQTRYGCTASEMVAGHRGLLKDSCSGDSGGPLYMRGANGQFLLLGATSRGTRGTSRVCGEGGVYVRVDKVIDWIWEETNADL